MSQRVASIFAEIGLDSSGFSKGANTIGGMVSNVIDTISGLHPAAALAVSGLSAMFDFMAESAKIADEANRIHARTEAVIRATGGAAGYSANQISDMASEMSALTGVDDELVESAAAILLTFRNVGNQAFPQAMTAAADLAAVMGTDLNGAVTMIGKALNEPVQGMTALRRVGVQLSDAQEEQVKQFMAVNDIASAQAVILDELQGEFGGAAQAMAEAGNKSEMLANAWENYKEALGQSVLPAQRSFNESMSNTLTNITENVQRTSDLRAMVLNLADATKAAAMSDQARGRYLDQFDGAARGWIATANRMTAQADAYRSAVEGAGGALGDLSSEIQSFPNEMKINFIFDYQAAKEQADSKLSELKEAQKETSEQVIALREKGAAGGLTEEESAQLDALVEKYGEITASIAGTNEELETFRKNMAFQMLFEKFKVGGIDDAEMGALLNFGKEMGTLDQETIQMVSDMMDTISTVDPGNVEDVWARLKDIVALDGRTITIYVNEVETGTDSGTGGTNTGQSGTQTQTTTTANLPVINMTFTAPGTYTDVLGYLRG